MEKKLTAEYLKEMVKKSFSNVDIDEKGKMCVLPFQSLVDTVDLYEKKIAEQKAEIERLNKCVMSELQVRKCCEDIIQDTIKQTVNDMGKEIYNRVTDNLKMWLRERYGVEVE